MSSSGPVASCSVSCFLECYFGLLLSSRDVDRRENMFGDVYSDLENGDGEGERENGKCKNPTEEHKQKSLSSLTAVPLCSFFFFFFRV